MKKETLFGKKKNEELREKMDLEFCPWFGQRIREAGHIQMCSFVSYFFSIL